MSRHLDPIRIQRQAAPSSPASNYDALYSDSTYGRLNVKNSSGVVRSVPWEFFYNVKDYGATGDGSTNDATAIQAALDLASSTNPGSTLFFPKGTYITNSELEIKGSVNIVMDGGCIVKRGSTSMQYIFKNFNSSYAPTLYGGRGNISISGGVIDGAATTMTTNCTSVCIAHADTVSVDNVTFQNVVDWHGLELNSTRNGKVTNCTFQGFKVVASTRWISEAIQIDLAINSSALPGIGAAAYDDTPCDNIQISGCTVRELGSLGSFGALTGSHSWADGFKHTNIQVIENYAQKLNDYMVNATNWDRVVVQGNECNDSNSFIQVTVPASMTADMFNFNIKGNIVQNAGVINNATAINPYCVNIAGIDATAAGNVIRQVTFSDNILDDIANTSAAVLVQNVSDMVMNGNTFQNCTGTDTVVDIEGSAKGVYSENKIDSATARGFWLNNLTNTNSRYCAFTGNNIAFTGGAAMDISAECVTVTGNQIFLSADVRGIAFFGPGDGGQATGNRVVLANSATPSAGAGMYNNSGTAVTAIGNILQGYTASASDTGAAGQNHHSNSGGWFPTAFRTYNKADVTTETT